MGSELFDPIFVPGTLREAVSDRAWLQAMLDAERALALAEARAGVISAEAAETIASRCDASGFDPIGIGEAAWPVGNPVEPLVRALRDAVGPEAAGAVHLGATSQDVLDTAAMLVTRSALDLVLAELYGIASACAALAERHRSTVLAGRTLLQQAVPTTFGLKAAGWLVGVLEAAHLVQHVRDERLAAQLGGAAGTLAALGDRGPDVLRLYAEELGLPEPVVPWHTLRARVAELGGALALAAGTSAKIAIDVALLMQTEVAEVAEPPGGVSSTMPQKRNPVGAVVTLACARQVQALASLLTAGLAQEHERAVGAWHAEWRPLSQALALTGGAAARVRTVLEGLEVDAARMRANVDERTLSERAALELGIGREALAGRPLREALADHVPAAELEEWLDPGSYLGAADVFVDRALALYRSGS